MGQALIKKKQSEFEIKFISAVIPFYNEEENVRPVIEELKNRLEQERLDYEVVCVDDGSSDRTWQELGRLRNSIHKLRMIRLRRNLGQTKALAIGIEAARGDWILTIDGDGQNDPGSISALLQKAKEGYDVVSGWRKNRKDSTFSRTIPSRLANGLLALITGLKLHDSGCALKLYRSEALGAISFYSDRHRLVPFLLHMRGFKVVEVVVKHRSRIRGVSKYGLSRTFKVLLDLMALTLLARFKEAPRFYFFIAALPFAIAGGLSLMFASLQFAGVVGIPGTVTFLGATVLLIYAASSLVGCGLLAEWFSYFEREKIDRYES